MIKAIIIENEVEASDALASLLEVHCKEVEVLGIYSDISGAMKALDRFSPNLVFLDIELNGESGFDLLEKISAPSFEVIFTTAFSAYALRAIKHACLEYLLKPINKDELKTALQKFNTKQTLHGYQQQVQILLQNLRKPAHESKICIPISGGFVFLNKSEIVMCQAEANYTVIYSTNKEKIICSKNLGFMEAMIDDENLFRCHKSYLINLNYIKKFLRKDSLQVILHDDLQAEVSQRKKDELLEQVKKGNEK